MISSEGDSSNPGMDLRIRLYLISPRHGPTHPRVTCLAPAWTYASEGNSSYPGMDLCIRG
eukprot:365525-Chlamydomonas_euryale.AAC.1